MIFKDKYFFLSTFYPTPITTEINGEIITFGSVEAAYHAHKNYSLAERFKHLKALEAKRYAENIPITTENWDIYKLYVMAKLLNIKFNNLSLLVSLKGIKEDIVSDNFWGDTFWGVYKGNGKNILGRMLNCIRDNNNNLSKLYNLIETEIINDI